MGQRIGICLDPISQRIIRALDLHTVDGQRRAHWIITTVARAD